MADLVMNGWRIFLHPCFLEQYETLLKDVEAAREADPQGYLKRPRAKMLAAIRKVGFVNIPANPADPAFRLGATLGADKKHWFRAKFLQQYRLFFRYRRAGRIIVLAWVNDESTKRAYGSSTDAYVVFGSMLASKRPPDDWDALMAECETTQKRATEIVAAK